VDAGQRTGLKHRGRVISEEVEVLGVTAADDRPDPPATCKRAGRTHEVTLLDVDIDADPDTSRLIAAYRRWTAYR
jgi:hypothetical protein